jgi:hypothetical protein
MGAEQRSGEQRGGEERRGRGIRMAMGVFSGLCRLQMHLGGIWVASSPRQQGARVTLEVICHWTNGEQRRAEERGGEPVRSGCQWECPRACAGSRRIWVGFGRPRLRGEQGGRVSRRVICHESRAEVSRGEESRGSEIRVAMGVLSGLCRLRTHLGGIWVASSPG